MNSNIIWDWIDDSTPGATLRFFLLKFVLKVFHINYSVTVPFFSSGLQVQFAIGPMFFHAQATTPFGTCIVLYCIVLYVLTLCQLDGCCDLFLISLESRISRDKQGICFNNIE